MKHTIDTSMTMKEDNHTRQPSATLKSRRLATIHTLASVVFGILSVVAVCGAGYFALTANPFPAFACGLAVPVAWKGITSSRELAKLHARAGR